MPLDGSNLGSKAQWLESQLEWLRSWLGDSDLGLEAQILFMLPLLKSDLVNGLLQVLDYGSTLLSKE